MPQDMGEMAPRRLAVTTNRIGTVPTGPHGAFRIAERTLVTIYLVRDTALLTAFRVFYAMVIQGGRLIQKPRAPPSWLKSRTMIPLSSHIPEATKRETARRRTTWRTSFPKQNPQK